MTIIISPFSRKMRNGKINPKNFPQWKEVVKELRNLGYEIIQIGMMDEEDIGANQRSVNLPLNKIRELVEESDLWMSVDNFMQHLCSDIKKGIVLFSQSNPNIFGVSTNNNILKDIKYLRKNQYDIWENSDYDENAFISIEDVLKEVELFTEEIGMLAKDAVV